MTDRNPTSTDQTMRTKRAAMLLLVLEPAVRSGPWSVGAGRGGRAGRD